MGWESNSIFQVVIIPGGGGGLFVYSGAPAAGNEPVFSVVAPGVTSDPFGNPVTAVVNAGTIPSAYTRIDGSGNIQLFKSSTIRIVLNPNLQAMLFYSPSLGAGNLVASISPAGGTDSTGNVFLPGLVSYVKILSTDFQAVQHNSGGINWWNAGSNAGPWNLIQTLQMQADEVGLGLFSNVNSNSVIFNETAAAMEVSGLLEILSGGLSWVGGATGDFANISRASNGTGGVLHVTQQQAAPTGTGLLFTGQAATDRLFGVDVVGDTSRRLTINPGGTIATGSGSAAPDTQLYRTGPAAWAADFIAFDQGGVAEVWNAVTFANGWVNAATAPNLQYRLVAAPDNCVQLAGRIVAPAGLVLPSNITAALPAAYRPNHTIQFAAWDVTQQTPTVLQLGTGGVISAQVGAAILAGDTVELMGGPLIPLTA